MGEGEWRGMGEGEWREGEREGGRQGDKGREREGVVVGGIRVNVKEQGTPHLSPHQSLTRVDDLLRV